MPIPPELKVYVNVLGQPTDDTYGETQITVPAKDKDRASFLTHCEQFFRNANRTADADKFHQAIKQTPQDPSDD